MNIKEIFDNNFFKNYWTKDFLLIKGDSERNIINFNYQSLNDILNFHSNTINSRILRVVNDGQKIDEINYFDTIIDPKYGQYQKLNTEKLKELVDHGCTIIIDEIQLMNYPVSQISNEFLDHFQEQNISVNAYFSLIEGNGFGWHFDTHDVFIYQSEGKKKWEISAISYNYPLPGQSCNNMEKPNSTSTDIVLNKGDILYIPRGMWHRASSCKEGSLHITFGIKSKTYIDIILEITEHLKNDENMRKNVLVNRKPVNSDLFIDNLIKIIRENKNSFLDDKYFDK